MNKKLRLLIIQYKEIILYLVFGGGTTCVNWFSYSFAVKLLDRNILAANIISWIFATIFAFVTNKIWVFESKEWSLSVAVKELFLFCSTRGFTGCFEIIAVPLLVHIGLDQMILGIEGMVSKILVSILVVILNYFISRFFIFKKREESK